VRTTFWVFFHDNRPYLPITGRRVTRITPVRSASRFVSTCMSPVIDRVSIAGPAANTGIVDPVQSAGYGNDRAKIHGE